jgi:hypothetical protein
VRLRAILSICGWTTAFLLLFDATAGGVFAVPHDPRRQPPSLANYFDYGRSVSGKLERLVGTDDARSAPIVLAGWIDRECIRPPRAAPPGGVGVTVYGMSFTQHVAGAMHVLDPRIRPTNYAGPGAPLSHSVACADAVREAGRDPNRIRVVGVLGSSLDRLLTLGGLTTSFEAPMPFTFPRYRLAAEGNLTVEQPLIHGPEGLRDPKQREAYFRQLAAGDLFYDRWQMEADPVDYSVVGRMLRRAWAQSEAQRRLTRNVLPDGRHLAPEVAEIAGRLLLRFAQSARSEGAMPIVLLLADQTGAPDMLDRSLAPLLEKHRIAFVSSRAIAPNDDPGNFTADGHFTPDIDRRLARRVLQLIAADIAREGIASSPSGS